MVGTNIVAFTDPKSFSDFTNDIAGNRQCFGFKAMMSNGEFVLAEYHGCGPKPEIIDIFRSWEIQVIN